MIISHKRTATQRQPPRFARAGFLGMLLMTFAIGPVARSQQSARLAWDVSTDPTVAGYNVYYGGESGTYTNVVSCGLLPATVIAGLDDGGTYYFVVTAYDVIGQESFPSNEASYSVPAAVTGTQLSISGITGGIFSLNATGLAGHTYEIQASTDFVSWSLISVQTAGSDGFFAFTDYDAPYYPARFYRTQDITP